MTEADTPLGLLVNTKQQYPFYYEHISRSVSEGKSPTDAALLYAASCCGMELSAASLAAARLGACYMWQQSKRMYVFDETLAQTLLEQAEDMLKAERLPVEGLSELPGSAFYVKAPDLIAKGLDGFFVWAEEAVPGNCVLQFAFLHDDLQTCTGGCLTLTGSLQEALPDPDAWVFPYIVRAAHQDARALKVVLCYTDPGGPMRHMIHNLLLRAVQLVIYVCCENADIEPSQGSGPDAKGEDGLRFKAITVGRNIGSALRKAAEVSGKARKAHTRRGHWHSYWVGPKNGDRRLITKWVAPVFVGSKIADVDVIVISD